MDTYGILRFDLEKIESCLPQGAKKGVKKDESIL